MRKEEKKVGGGEEIQMLVVRECGLALLMAHGPLGEGHNNNTPPQ